MDFSQISQLLRDVLAIVESPQVQKLYSDFSADVSGQSAPPTVQGSPASYRGNVPNASSSALAQSFNAPVADPNNPTGQVLPPRAVR